MTWANSLASKGSNRWDWPWPRRALAWKLGITGGKYTTTKQTPERGRAKPDPISTLDSITGCLFEAQPAEEGPKHIIFMASPSSRRLAKTKLTKLGNKNTRPQPSQTPSPETQQLVDLFDTQNDGQKQRQRLDSPIRIEK